MSDACCGRTAGASMPAGRAAPPGAIEHRAGHDAAPLSMMQQRVWFLENLQPGSLVHHLASAHRLSGALDEAVFEQAFAALLSRQPVLRTVIAMNDGEPVQRVLPEVGATLFPAHDIAQMPQAEQQAWLERRMAALASQPFDLMGGPLWRARMFRLAPDEHVLLLVVHHIVWDDRSFDLFCREMAALLPAAAEGALPPAPVQAVTCADFAAWQYEWLQGPEQALQLDHWKHSLQGGLEPLDLPTDHARPAVQTGAAGSVRIELPRAEADAVRQLAGRLGTSPSVVLLALLAALVQRMVGRPDLIIGMPVHGRHRAGTEAAMGCFANLLPLRLNVDAKAPLHRLIGQAHEAVQAAACHADMPFEQLVRALDLPRDQSRFPICPVQFSCEDGPARPARWGRLGWQAYPLRPLAIAGDLALGLQLCEDGLHGQLAYNADVFDPASMALVARRYVALVRQAAQGADLSVAVVTAPPPAEQARMAQWNATAMDYDRGATVAVLLESWRTRGWSDRPAVRSGSLVHSYAQLHGRAEQLARLLRSRGVGRGQLVGLCVERGADMLAAQLALLKSGAGYVPLDPAYPADRLAYMAQDARLAVLVTQAPLADTVPWPREHSVWLDDDAAQIAAQPTGALAADAALDAQPGDPAYVIYTSGSTGKPKGVAVPHGAVVNFLLSMQREPGLSGDDRLVAVTTLSFDIAVLELLLPLSVGAQVVLAGREQVIDGGQLKALLQQQQASVMQATPATWRMLIEAGWQGGPDFKALIGGEALPLDLAQQLLARCGQLWNMYGPTETTVWSTCTQVQRPEAGITIGRPIANTQVHILDDDRQPVPIGVAGEIWIGGDGVTLGYMNRPELTAERFIDDPFRSGAGAAGARLYRTGDKGRWKPDGQLEHMGRLDFQVKVRGYRIELGEIEAALATHAQVARCVVITREDQPGDVRLVAYVVARDQMPEAGRLKEHLAQTLPQYMLPQHIVALAAIPLLPNGKVDRKGLPPPQEEERSTAAGFAAPRSDAERAIAAIWSELLGIDRIAVTDNFFDLGGHSLLAMRAVTMIEKQLGHSLQVRRFIFETLGQLAAGATVPAAAPVAPAARQQPAAPARRGGVVGRLLGALRLGNG